MAETENIFRRKVFYICGFDPRGAGFYHRLYKKHAQLQSSVNGISYNVSSRRKLSPVSHVWDVRSAGDSNEAVSHFEFLSWDDIVKEHWDNGIQATLNNIWCFFKDYVVNGLFKVFAKHSPQILISGFYPGIFIFFSAVLSLWSGYCVAGFFNGLLQPPAFFLTSIIVFKLMMYLAEKMAAFWLQRITVFASRWSRGEVKNIDKRIDEFSERIVDSMQQDYDEVMIVSHSVGCMLAVPVLADVLRKTQGLNKKISMVTLGQCIPLISFQPAANEYRRSLDLVAHSERVIWLDYTSKTDGVCFPLLDFVTASGIERHENSNLRILSPRFFTLYTSKNYRRLRVNWYKMHFLYLLSTDYVGGYDYFEMTAGTHPLKTVVG